jgi:hypothetical protein
VEPPASYLDSTAPAAVSEIAIVFMFAGCTCSTYHGLSLDNYSLLRYFLRDTAAMARKTIVGDELDAHTKSEWLLEGGTPRKI